MFFHDRARNRAHVLVAYAAVVGALRTGVAVPGEAKRAAVLVEEVLLLKAHPEIGIVLNRSARVCRMWRAVRMHHFAQYDVSILATCVRVQSHRLQNAVGTLALGLHRGTAVESPQRHVLERWCRIERLDRCLAAQFWDRLLAVEPNVLEFVLSHGSPSGILKMNMHRKS